MFSAIARAVRTVVDNRTAVKEGAKTTAHVVRQNDAGIARAVTPGGGATDNILQAAGRGEDVSRRDVVRATGDAAAETGGRMAIRQGASDASAKTLAPFALASKKNAATAVGTHEGVATAMPETDGFAERSVNNARSSELFD